MHQGNTKFQAVPAFFFLALEMGKSYYPYLMVYEQKNEILLNRVLNLSERIVNVCHYMDVGVKQGESA